MRRAISDADDGFAHGVAIHASATSITRRGGSAISGAAQRRTAARSLSRVRYSTGDFPSTLARNSAGKQRGRARFEAVALVPIDSGEIGARQRRKGGAIARPVGPLARALQEEVVETERKIKGRIAEPCAFGVEEDWPERPLHNVLRTDIAVNQRALRLERGPRERVEARCKPRMGAACGAQVRLDADRFERVVIGEGGRDAGVGGAPGMDDGEVAPDGGGEIRLDAAGEQLRLP